VLDGIRIQKVLDHFLIGGLVQVRLPFEEMVLPGFACEFSLS
jgi:hypothetical protein